MHVYLVACAAACLSGGAELLSEPPSTCIAFLSVRSETTIDQTMDPRCVRAANALARLYICTGSSELSMFA